MSNTHYFELSLNTVVGWSLLAVRAYEGTDGIVEPGSPNDLERRALALSLGATWSKLGDDKRADVYRMLARCLNADEGAAFDAAVSDLQARAMVEAEISKFTTSESSNP